MPGTSSDPEPWLVEASRNWMSQLADDTIGGSPAKRTLGVIIMDLPGDKLIY